MVPKRSPESRSIRSDRRRLLQKYVLDSNCYIDAAREPAARTALEAFIAREAPRLYLSSVVAAELRTEPDLSATGANWKSRSWHPLSAVAAS